MALWIEFYLIFVKQVHSKNHEKVRKILNFAAWCFSEKSGKLPNDTSTAVTCAFYEDIASHKDFWPMFNDWFFPHEFEKIKGCFKYHLSEKDFSKLENIFYKHNKR